MCMVAVQVPSKLSYIVNFRRPMVRRVNEHDRLKMEGCANPQPTAGPHIPFKEIAILIPKNREVESVGGEAVEEAVLPGSYIIEPGRRPILLSGPEGGGNAIPDPCIDESSSPYPGDIVGGTHHQVKNGYHIFSLNLYPVRYVPSRKQFIWYPTITVRLKLRRRAWAVSDLYPRDLESDREEVRRMVINPEVLDTYRGR